MLSLRLKEISEFVPNNSHIINIGTDHALLEIYLTENKNVICIGTDINEYSIRQALNNVQKSNLDIKIIKSDGLDNIKLNSEIIIISGLGTRTILSILNKKINNDLIIQSNNNINELKKELKRKHYYVYKEKTIYDKRWYTIIYFKRKHFFRKTKSIIIKNDAYLKYLIHVKEKEFKKIPKTKFIKRLKKKLTINRLRLSVNA